MRPNNSEQLPCVHYIHGGGMDMMSCYEKNFPASGKIIAANGVAVAMADSALKLAIFCARDCALSGWSHDCVSGLKWVHANADALHFDPKRIIVAGESGGGISSLRLGLSSNGTVTSI